MINLFCCFIICLFQLASAWDLQAYDQRLKGFEDWQEQQEEARRLRQAAADAYRETRLKVLLQKIRARQQFKREYRTTAHLEEEYLRSLEGRDEFKDQERKEFSSVHKKFLNFYERKVLPIKKVEYGLEQLPELPSAGQGKTNE